MDTTEQCEIKGCERPVQYQLYKISPDGERQWLHVCKEHEDEIGWENIGRRGGYLTESKLIEIRKALGGAEGE